MCVFVCMRVCVCVRCYTNTPKILIKYYGSVQNYPYHLADKKNIVITELKIF